MTNQSEIINQLRNELRIQNEFLRSTQNELRWYKALYESRGYALMGILKDTKHLT